MCTARIVASATKGLSPEISRRSALRWGAMTLGAVALGRGAAAAPVMRPAVRSLEMNHLMDLTHTLTDRFPIFPAPLNTPFGRRPIATITEDGWHSNRWDMIEHCGTHIDAPAHMVEGGDTLEEMPLPSMICPAAVIDISERAARDPDTMLTVDDILTWETRHGRIPQGAAVMMHSGYDRHVETPGIFLGTDMVGGLHFPGFSEEASIYLAEECDIAFAGVDTLSLDRGRSTDFEAHHALLGAGVWGIECLKNLRHIPPSGATVFIGVPKVEGGSGGPCRVIASWE